MTQLSINPTITVSYDVTWFKGQANEVTKTLTKTLDFSNLSGDDILEYACRPVVILDQAKQRNKLPGEAELTGTIVVQQPGTRMVSKEKFQIVTFLTEQGISSAQAQMLAKMRGKDQTLQDFVQGLQNILLGFGMTIDLVSKLPKNAE